MAKRQSKQLALGIKEPPPVLGEMTQQQMRAIAQAAYTVYLDAGAWLTIVEGGPALIKALEAVAPAEEKDTDVSTGWDAGW